MTNLTETRCCPALTECILLVQAPPVCLTFEVPLSLYTHLRPDTLNLSG